MKRGKPLRSSVEKQQAWQERARERALERERERERDGKAARAAAIRRTVATSSKDRNGQPVRSWRQTNPRSRRASIPGLRGFTQRVFMLYGDRCVVCRRRAHQAHHAIPVRTLFAQGKDVAHELAGDQRNGVPVCSDCHEHHENASRRIRRGELPTGVIEWAGEHGFGWLIDDQRVYPRGLVR